MELDVRENKRLLNWGIHLSQQVNSLERTLDEATQNISQYSRFIKKLENRAPSLYRDLMTELANEISQSNNDGLQNTRKRS